MTAVPQGAKSALRDLYRDFDEETARIAPVCRASGRCCDFDAFGHTLFASRLEAEVLVEESGGLPPETPGLCPWWVERQCTARAPRPLGCRAFFCDESKDEAMTASHEAFLSRLKDIHREHELPWNYAPLLRHLADLRDMGGNP
ncbi:MAG: hypothetical protein ACYTDX_09160 [Planctomycetota bacterium]|jgi:hypothetical protein